MPKYSFTSSSSTFGLRLITLFVYLVGSLLANPGAPVGAAPASAASLAPSSVAPSSIGNPFPLAVFVGYADDLRSPGNLPDPWIGSTNTLFIGTGDNWDAGAMRLDNPTDQPISVASVSVYFPNHIGNPTFNLWGSFTIPANGSAILTQTDFYNFDTSDYGPNPCGVRLDPTVSPPQLTVTLADVNNTSQTFQDTGHVLDTGGYDTACQPGSETIQWQPINPCPWDGQLTGDGKCGYTYKPAEAVRYAIKFRSQASTLFCRYAYPGLGQTCFIPTKGVPVPTDCANYVSQTMLYGGLPMVTDLTSPTSPNKSWYCSELNGVCQKNNNDANWAGANQDQLPLYLERIGGTRVDDKTSGLENLDMFPRKLPSSSIPATPMKKIILAMMEQQLGPDDSPNQITQGDILFTYPNTNSHVGLVVGWGPYLSFWDNSVIRFGYVTYPTWQEAKNAGISDPVIYVIDHGLHGTIAGSTPAQREAWTSPKPYYALKWSPDNLPPNDFNRLNDAQRFGFIKIKRTQIYTLEELAPIMSAPFNKTELFDGQLVAGQ